MHQTGLVNGHERLADLDRDDNRHGGRQTTAAHPSVEGFAVGQLHRQIDRSFFGFADIKNARAVLMHHAPRLAGLGEQGATVLGTGRQPRVQELQRQRHQRHRMTGAEHRAHTAAAEDALDQELAIDDGPEQRVGRIGLAATLRKVCGRSRQQRHTAVGTAIEFGRRHAFTGKADFHGWVVTANAARRVRDFGVTNPGGVATSFASAARIANPRQQDQRALGSPAG